MQPVQYFIPIVRGALITSGGLGLRMISGACTAGRLTLRRTERPRRDMREELYT